LRVLEGVEVHGQLTLSTNVRLLKTKYKRSMIAFGVTPIAFTDVSICAELLQTTVQSLIGSPGTLRLCDPAQEWRNRTVAEHACSKI